MPVEFQDFSLKVKDYMKDAAVAWLHEASGEIVSGVNRNLDKEKGNWHKEQKKAWQNIVDENKLEATVGNPMERSLWTEFGTGSHADGGKGRKGYWVYVKGGDGSSESDGDDTTKKAYTLEEAKKVMAILQGKGLDAHVTNGQEPKRPLKNAYIKLKPKLIKRANEIFKEGMK